jgi:hypothetical protein
MFLRSVKTYMRLEQIETQLQAYMYKNLTSLLTL